MSNCWQEKSVQLRFLLGELRLGAVNLRGLVLNHGLHPRPELSVPDLPRSVNVAVIRSHPLPRAVPEYSGSTAAFRYIPDRYYRCYVDLRQTLPDYLKKFSSKSRYTLRKKVRRFTSLSNGRSDVRAFSRPDEMEEFHVLARQISAKTYQERLLRAGIPDDPTFVTEMRSLAERDAVRAYTLFLDDCPVAYMYCAAMEENDLIYRFVGHDPEYGHLSPGVVLQYFALESLFAEQRFDSLDFGEGTGMHKQFFSTGSLACANVYYFRDTARYRALMALHALLRFTSRTAAAVFEAVGIKHKLKRLLREGPSSIVRSAGRKTSTPAEVHHNADSDLAGEHLATDAHRKIG